MERYCVGENEVERIGNGIMSAKSLAKIIQREMDSTQESIRNLSALGARLGSIPLDVVIDSLEIAKEQFKDSRYTPNITLYDKRVGAYNLSFINEIGEIETVAIYDFEITEEAQE